MSDRDRWIQRHLFRLRTGQFLHHAGEWLAGFLIVFGMSVLLVKRLTPEMWPHVLWLAAACAPIAYVAWRLSQRGQFTRDESVALLDGSLNAGGLLMALSEMPDDEWSKRLPHLEERWRESLPRMRPRRFASCIALPLLFALGVCFVPLREVRSAGEEPPVTAGQQAAQRLENLLAALKEAEALEEEEEQALEEEIDKLVEETRRSPLTHEKWETVDALEQRMKMELERADRQAEKLSSAASLLAAAAAGEGPPLTDEQLEELEEELLETLVKKEESQSSSGSAGAGQSELKDMLQRLTKNGTQQAQLPSDPQEREQLLNELRDMLGKEQQALAELRQQCEGGQCSKCGQANCPGGSQCQGGQNGQCSQCGGQCKGGQGLCSECAGGNKPGRGGISRGRGDAELTWGDEADEQGVKFKETVLPPGFLEDPKDEIVGVKLGTPKVDPAASAARSASRDADAATGRETWERKLRPRHKEVVRQFFNAGE
jgi:hypothetical protein